MTNWTTERPKKPGDYWLSLPVANRVLFASPDVVRCVVFASEFALPSLYVSWMDADGCCRIFSLQKDKLDGAQWAERTTPNDPFAKPEPKQYVILDTRQIVGANRICDELGRPDRIAAPGSGLIAWACSDEVGMSSVFMARRLSAHAGLRFPGHRIKDEPAHPYDPDDFGRCLGLLEAVPELREHVPKMAEHGKVWTTYVAHWAEMEALYQEESPLGRAPKLAALMKRLQESAS